MDAQHFAACEAEQCRSHFQSEHGEVVRCTRVIGHVGYHQDDRYNWPEKAAIHEEGL